MVVNEHQYKLVWLCRRLDKGGEAVLNPLFVLYGESRMKYTEVHENDFTTRG
jgi:hypothetical protein